MQKKTIAATIGLALLAATAFLTVSSAPAANQGKTTGTKATDCCTTSDPACCPAGKAAGVTNKPVVAKTDDCCNDDPCCR